MKVSSGFGIAKRLYLMSFTLIVALAGVACATWWQLNQVAELSERIGTNRTPQLLRMAEVELDVTRVSLQIRHALLVKSPADLASTLSDIGAKHQHIDATLQAFELALFTPTGHESFAKIRPLVKDFWAVGTVNVALIEAGKKDEAFTLLVEKTIPARNLLLGALDAEKKRQGSQLTTEIAEVGGRAQRVKAQFAALVGAVAVGLLAFSWSIASFVRRRVAASQAVAERVRDGDLALPVTDDARDEFSALQAALSDMQTSLARVVSTVRENSESVATASAEISQGNNDLSQRTEQQASALEQTAAAMEELGSTVRQNADNARQANQLAMGASTVAIKGGEVVNQVVDTMKDINASSKRIVDIISVIDGIAFQTNILALNAAVEAARAGEQGRGFAVVASEVRSLAHRSAEAAKEIKSLISASVERVEQGTLLVDQAGATMTEVVSSIRRVTDIMGEISIASVEQSTGVAQVGEAVTQMDQATQQNAALVEESAAAAESLKVQALQLVQAVAVFKLASGRAAAAPVGASPTPRRTENGTGASAVVATKPAAKPALPIDRRGPNRATNVVRPAFKAAPAATARPVVATPANANASTGTGTDDWESF